MQIACQSGGSLQRGVARRVDPRLQLVRRQARFRGGGKGVLTISQEQPQLKRITWELFWLSPDGKEETYKRIFFLHENAMYWEQYGMKDMSFLRPGTEGQAGE